MTGPSLLIGLALAVAVVAYVLRPFRAVRPEDWGRSIENWVAAARATQVAPSADPRAPVDLPAARFCRECGRALTPDSRFCSHCGTPVEGHRQ